MTKKVSLLKVVLVSLTLCSPAASWAGKTGSGLSRVERKFFNAVKHGDTAKVAYLLNQGANANLAIDGVPILHIAAGKGHPRIVRLLVKKGAKVNVPDNDGATALHRAANTSLEIVKFLLKNDADVSVSDKDGVTALHWASQCHPYIVEYLLKSGADVDSKDNQGRTPLDWLTVFISCHEPIHKKVASAFLNYGAKPTQYTHMGDSVFHHAVKKGQTRKQTLLLSSHLVVGD